MLFVIYACIILILSANKSNSWNTYASEKDLEPHGFFAHIFEGVLPPRSLACGVFSVVFSGLLVEVFGEKTSRLKKKIPSLKWSHGAKRHHFVFSLVPCFVLVNMSFNFLDIIANFFVQDLGTTRAIKISIAHSRRSLTRRWLAVDGSTLRSHPAKSFETKNSTWKIWIEQISDLQFQDRFFFLRRDYTKIVVVKVICFSNTANLWRIGIGISILTAKRTASVHVSTAVPCVGLPGLPATAAVYGAAHHSVTWQIFRDRPIGKMVIHWGLAETLGIFKWVAISSVSCFMKGSLWILAKIHCYGWFS